jgi:hypothetical protein
MSRVTVLVTGRWPTVARLAGLAASLTEAAGEPVRIEVFSWQPLDPSTPPEVTVVGPVASRRPRLPPEQRTRSVAAPAPAAPVPAAPVPDLDHGRAAPEPGSLRFSAPYQLVRRLIRGDLAHRFARALRGTPVLDVARDSEVVVALDQHAVLAAWRIARAVPGPDVVLGAAAAEQALRTRAGIRGPQAAAAPAVVTVHLREGTTSPVAG